MMTSHGFSNPSDAQSIISKSRYFPYNDKASGQAGTSAYVALFTES